MAKKKSEELKRIAWDEPGRTQERLKVFKLMGEIEGREKELKIAKEILIDFDKQLRAGKISVVDQQGNKLNKVQLRKEISHRVFNKKVAARELLMMKEELYFLLKDEDLEKVKEEIKNHFKTVEFETLKQREALEDVV